jgi:hypothetical protein
MRVPKWAKWLGGGIIFVLTWDIPAPTRPVEVVVPNERLPK